MNLAHSPADAVIAGRNPLLQASDALVGRFAERRVELGEGQSGCVAVWDGDPSRRLEEAQRGASRLARSEGRGAPMDREVAGEDDLAGAARRHQQVASIGVEARASSRHRSDRHRRALVIGPSSTIGATTIWRRGPAVGIVAFRYTSRTPKRRRSPRR